VGWVVRSNLSSTKQDDYVRSADEGAPLHAREVTALGRDNAVTMGQWRDVLDVVFKDLHAAGARAGGPLTLTAAQVEAAIAAVRGREGGRLVHSNMLRRAVSWHALASTGGVAHLGAPVPPPPVWSDSPLEGPIGDLPRLPTLDDALGRSAQEDAPLPPLVILSLYSAIVGGRPEPFAPKKGTEAAAAAAYEPVVDDPTRLASPTDRLELAIELVRRYARLLEALRPSASSAHPPAPLPRGPPYSLSELTAVVGLLGETHQTPTRNRTRTVSTWPLKLWAFTRPGVQVADALVEAGIQDATSLPLGLGAPGALEWAGFLPPPTYRVGHEGPLVPVHPSVTDELAAAGLGGHGERSLNGEQGFKVVLGTRAVCAWGECYARE
jgi:hypothetical protein